MKKHNIPPETTDEDLIQAMETLLDQETPDQEAIRAILEELDRRAARRPLTRTPAGQISRPGGRQKPSPAAGASTGSPSPSPPCWCAWRCRPWPSRATRGCTRPLWRTLGSPRRPPLSSRTRNSLGLRRKQTRPDHHRKTDGSRRQWRLRSL